MKRIALGLLSALTIALGACENETANTLGDGRAGSQRGATAGGEDSTYDHSNDPGGAAPGADFQPPDPAQTRLVGSPEVTSRLHACGKMTNASIAQLIQSRDLNGGVPQGQQTAGQIFQASGASLGGANYPGRVPEAPFASTSAMAKMFDIFAMAAYAVVQNDWAPAACEGTKVLGPDGKFTKDGISCLIGKPATDDHVAIANDAITQDPTDGAKIAIVALLSAAHTCQ